MGTEPHPPASRVTRLLSLDAFRGLAIAGMILVNNPGSWDHVYAPLRHAEWLGVTPTDLIFPFFLFAIGVSMPFSFASRRGKGAGNRELWLHVLRRSAVIYGLGLTMALYPEFDFATVRLVGVLARIGMVYLMAGTLVLFLSRRALFTTAVGGLLLYWALMTLVPVPGFGAGDLSPEGNLASWLDRLILGRHMWRGGGGVFDPEGLLSTIPAVVSTLAGVFAGDALRGASSGSGPGSPLTPTTAVRLGAMGVVLVAVGWAWGLVFPLAKNIWTSSYVVYTTGWALIVIGLLHWSMDVRGWRGWAKPLVVYGMNAITVFVASGLVAKTLIRWEVTPREPGGSTSMYGRIFEVGFEPWLAPCNASLAFAIATVLFWLAAMWWMYRRRIFLKV